MKELAMLKFSQSVAGFIQRRVGFNPLGVDLELAVEKVAPCF
jgi:hypothetical protein